MNTKKLALCGILTALSLIMFLVESLFPPLFVPGAKLGLGNIFIVIALVYLGYGYALIALLSKCVISTFFGGFSALLYSLPAGLVSLTVSYILLLQKNKIGIIAICLMSATLHNLVQNAVFALVMRSVLVFSYSPYLALLGMIAGLVTGISAYFIIRRATPFIIKKFKLNIEQEEESGII